MYRAAYSAMPEPQNSRLVTQGQGFSLPFTAQNTQRGYAIIWPIMKNACTFALICNAQASGTFIAVKQTIQTTHSLFLTLASKYILNY